MRTSITKTAVVALSLTAAITFAAAPAADAKVRTNPVSNARFEEGFRDQDPIFGGSPVQRIIRVAKKVVVIVQELPLIPIP